MTAFTNLIGQERAVKLLKSSIDLNRIAPAYLFYGSSGIGRALAAGEFAKLLLIRGLSPAKQTLAIQKINSENHPDLRWVQPTYLDRGELISPAEAQARNLSLKTRPKLRIEQIRQIIEFLHRPPLEASRLVVIIKETQNMSEAVANALLKTLEEPGKATLILISTNLDVLLPTIVSRCQQVRFDPLSQADLSRVLGDLGYSDILQHPEIIATAQGSPGEAISSWQKMQRIPSEIFARLRQIPHNSLEAISLASQVTKELDFELQLWSIDYLQNYYWQKLQLPEIAQKWEDTRRYLLASVQPRLVWECTLLQLLSFRAQTSTVTPRQKAI
jgi:DNA polymerase-3 subunit delta'